MVVQTPPPGAPSPTRGRRVGRRRARRRSATPRCRRQGCGGGDGCTGHDTGHDRGGGTPTLPRAATANQRTQRGYLGLERGEAAGVRRVAIEGGEVAGLKTRVAR